MDKKSPFASVRMDKVCTRIIWQIRQRILKGELHTGDRLASEQEMIEQFDVSRQTLREAVTVMEYMGFLERRTGMKGGIYVGAVDEEHVRECLFDFLAFQDFQLVHIFEVRELLEHYAVRIALERNDTQITDRLRENNETMRKAIAENDLAAADEAAIAFHRTIVASTGNPVLIFLTNCVENLLNTAKTTLVLDASYCSSVLEGHERILEALLSESLSSAQQSIQEDLEHVKQSLESLSLRSPQQQRVDLFSNGLN